MTWNSILQSHTHTHSHKLYTATFGSFLFLKKNYFLFYFQQLDLDLMKNKTSMCTSVYEFIYRSKYYI